jgi:hypothetical protein
MQSGKRNYQQLNRNRTSKIHLSGVHFEKKVLQEKIY